MSTQAGPGSRDAIAAHAQKLIDAKIADGTIVPDSNSAVAAAAMPSFSEGTLALDDRTGRPIIPGNAVTAPAITDGTTIDPNATGALGNDADAGAALEAAAAGRADAPRDPQGRFAAPEKPLAADAPAAATPAPAQRAAAADAAAAQVLDDWADFETLTFEHDDGSKYQVRARRAEAKQIERFNRRQAQVDRHASWLSRYRPTLEPLIVEGRLDPILPVLQRALADNDFGNAVIEMFNRRAMGQPMYPQAAAPAAPAGAPPAGAPAPAAALQIPEITDPYVAEVIAPVLATVQQQFGALQARLDTYESTGREQQQRAAAAAEQQRQRNLQVWQGHQDLARMYPTEFTGDPVRDQAALTPILRYAREGGYVEQYGPRAGVVLAAQQYRAERADTASPAADMLAAIDRTTLQAAGVQAGAARSVAGGTAAVQPARRALPKPPDIHDAQGRRKDPRTFMAEQQAYRAAMIAAGAA
jgi:hypothetical protein